MRSTLIALSTLVLLSACGIADESDLVPGPTPRPLALRLLDGRTLTVAPSGSTMLVTGHYRDGHSAPRVAAVAVQAGSVDIGLTEHGTFGLNVTTLELGDVIAYPAGSPLHLTDLRVTLAEPVRLPTEWRDDGFELRAVGNVSLLLDWALQREGQAYPLAQQRLDAIPVDITVTAMGQDHVALRITAAAPGVFWSWAGMLELADLELSLNASDAVAGPVIEQAAP